MSYRRVALLSLGLLLTLTLVSAAQQAAPSSAVNNDFIQKQFGETCTLLPGPMPFRADVNGDGIEDIVMAGRCTNPMMDAAEHNYQVVDPYFTYFGYGDPKISSEFATDDPDRRSLVLLVIHGDGPEAWRSNTPKAKFVIINLPFKQFQVKKLTIKKKTMMGIYVEETGGDQMISVLAWDGKKYRYVPLGSTLE